jgi:hypothetical protein
LLPGGHQTFINALLRDGHRGLHVVTRGPYAGYSTALAASW